MQTIPYGASPYAQRFTGEFLTAVHPVPNFSVCGGNAFSWSIRFCATRPAGDASLIQQEGIFMLGTKEGKLFYSAAGLGELNSGDGYTLQENVWYTVLVTYGQSELSLYIDGVRVASKTVSAASKVGNADYQIGRLFQGFIAHVRLYNFQLSPEQAKNEYKSDPLEQSKLELALNSPRTPHRSLEKTIFPLQTNRSTHPKPP
ncbi:MAG: LamG domain-containing protein [Oscillospiraceae bacterium]